MNNLTDGMSYLVNANIPSSVTQLQGTTMAMGGCQGIQRRITDTAFSLLEISFGDGLADALEQSRTSDYTCPGYTQDGLISYILVFWVFLTNVLILNMLIAMMNYTFDKQIKEVHSVWLLDVSYRIMRYERIFPELVTQLHRPVVSYSIWRLKFWAQFADNCVLVLYCLPEFHFCGHRLGGYSLFAAFLNLVRGCQRSQMNSAQEFDEIITEITGKIKEEVDEKSTKVQQLIRPVIRGKGRLASESLNILARKSSVPSEVNRWKKAIYEKFNVQKLDTDVLDKFLLFVSLIFQLEMIGQSLNETQSKAETRPWRKTKQENLPVSCINEDST